MNWRILFDTPTDISFPKGNETHLRDDLKKTSSEPEKPTRTHHMLPGRRFLMAESTVPAPGIRKAAYRRVKSYPVHKSVLYSGFVIPGETRTFITKPDMSIMRTTITCIREFLTSHPVEYGKHLHVMDNCSWHKKSKTSLSIDAAVCDIKEAATIISLPPYSPDLNPIEQVWRVTRREKTHN